MSSSFVDLVRRNAREADQLGGEHADKFLELLKELRDRIQGRAAQFTDSPIDAFAIARVDAETKAAIATLEAKSRGIFGAASRDVAQAAVGHLGTELDHLSSKVEGRILDVVPDAAQALADPTQALLANHFETSMQRYGGELLNKVRQQMFIGMRTGQPVNDLVRSIAGERGPMGVVGRNKAELIVRTETSNAYGAAVHNGIGQLAKKVSGIRKTWVHIGSYPCPVCIPLDGTSRPMDGTWTIKSGKRSFKVVHPPAHPRCVCRAVASKPSWDKAIERLGYGQPVSPGR